jgi:hypothetical protein
MAMWTLSIRLLVSAAIATSIACALDLRALPEFFRPDPFGGVVEVDRPGSAWAKAVQLRAARAGYVSTHLVVDLQTKADYEINVEFPFPVEVYREWYHLNTADRKGCVGAGTPPLQSADT